MKRKKNNIKNTKCIWWTFHLLSPSLTSFAPFYFVFGIFSFQFCLSLVLCISLVLSFFGHCDCHATKSVRVFHFNIYFTFSIFNLFRCYSVCCKCKHVPELLWYVVHAWRARQWRRRQQECNTAPIHTSYTENVNYPEKQFKRVWNSSCKSNFISSENVSIRTH